MFGSHARALRKALVVYEMPVGRGKLYSIRERFNPHRHNHVAVAVKLLRRGGASGRRIVHLFNPGLIGPSAAALRNPACTAR